MAEVTPELPHGGSVLLVGWRSGTVRETEALGRPVVQVVAPGDLQEAQASGFAGRLVCVPQPDNPADVLGGLVREGLELSDFVAVGSNLEACVVSAGIVGQLAGARCITPHTAVLLRDKIAQKIAVRDAGLPVAACFSVDSVDQLIRMRPGYPLVLKPLAGAGTVDTFLLAGAEEAEAVSRRLGGAGSRGPWAVEEFVTGPEIQVNGVVRDGRVVVLTVSRYLQNLIDIKDDGAVGTVLLDPAVHTRLYEESTDLTERALKSFGHTDGVFHLEAFDQGNRIVFSECAGRTSGGMVREMLRRKYGMDLVTEWGRALLGLPTRPSFEPLDGLHYGTANLTSAPGRIVGLPALEELLALPGVVEATIDVAVGGRVPDFRVASNKRMGRFVVAAASEGEVQSALEATIAWFRSRTEVTG